ncbi:MAG: DUF445 domain-containing protein [Chitinophagaceae bacterium]
MNYWLFILIPISSAFIGWITIRILLKMLFHPRKLKKIFGIRFQGVFPQRQQQIAEQLGKQAGQGFISFDSIEQKISDPANLEKILPVVEEHIDDFLRNRLGKEMPMISMFIGDKTIGKLKEAFMKEIGNMFPQVMKQYAANLKQDLNIEKLIVQKISSLSGEKLEKILWQQMSRELRLAGILGAAIGFVIGLLQLLLLYSMA